MFTPSLSRPVLYVGLVLLVAASPAVGQLCVGYPTAPGQKAVAMNVGTLTGGDRYGLDANVNLADGFSAFGGFTATQLEGRSVGTSVSVGVGVALFATRFGGTSGEAFQGCPTASLVMPRTDDPDTWRMPVGLGFGTSYPLGAEGTTTLQPWILPAVVFSRLDHADTELELSLGANVGVGQRFFFGGSVNRVLLERADSRFALRAGLIF